MCGRYGHDLSWAELYDIFKPMVLPAAAPNLEPDWDVRPTTRQWVVRSADGGHEVARMRWGLVPFWWRGASLKEFKLTTFNARAETVATAPSFRESFKRRRCLVPASCWYEWTGAKGGKTKWRFTDRDGGLLTFAGLWDRCRIGEDELESFTIVVQPAGAPLNGYHDRAPVVIRAADHAQWLDPAADPTPLIGPESRDEFHIAEA